MADHDVDVAVLGAGPTGLTAANLLGRAGLSVAVVERNPGTVDAPRAVSIDDESLRTLQAAGLSEAVLADVAQDYGSYYLTARGRRFLSVAPTTRDYGFPKRNAFSQPILEATLRRGLDRFAGITQLFAHDCEEIAEDGQGVTLHLRRAGDGAAVTLRAAYVLGSDGARSLARKHVGATLEGASYKQRWLIVDLGASRERLRQTRILCDPARPFITLPGPHGIRRYEFLLHEHEDQGDIAGEDRVRALLAACGPDSDAPILRRQVYAFHARIADRWNSPRVYLAGDAAHLSPPFAGQGMNSGLRDAHNIAWKLAAVVQGRLGPGLLASYEAERKPHATALVQLAVRLGRVMVPRSRPEAFVVQGAFRLAGLFPRVQSYFGQMKYKPKPHYHAGFLLPGGSAARLVGRMLPQPVVETGLSRFALLDEVLGDDLRLVAYGEDAQRAFDGIDPASPAGRLGRPLAILPAVTLPDRAAGDAVEVVRDRDGMLAAICPPGRTVLMLLRPDRYVAAASLGPAAQFSEQVGQLLRDSDISPEK